ncbi:MAG: 2,3-bisphosphoglycerate-dependent phosphoglycerate mutase [Ralstonia sp.]|nr:MAG: 2,3-bisphosphoglycerate-dependent phosphoglycerate mutase [Ralstonia sp.]
MSGRLVLLRHGESKWNRDQRFTGWADVELTALGQTQMREACRALRDAGIEVDLAFASVLRRCVHSLWIALDEMQRFWIPQQLDWRLNERNYGGLTGLLREDALRAFGEAKVRHWRRSPNATPPPVDERASSLIAIDARYPEPAAHRALQGESLLQTMDRVREAWMESVAPSLHQGRRVLMVGHGNALRALTAIVEDLDDDRVAKLEIANGTPVVYELNDSLKPRSKTVLDAGSRTPSEIL